MTEGLVCWKCGASLKDLLLPLERRAACPVCRSELHVCRMCEFFDPSVSQACREPVADHVQDKTRANFCGYFTPMPRVRLPQNADASQAARSELDALFGEPPAADVSGQGASPQSAATTDEARDALEDLFRSDPEKE